MGKVKGKIHKKMRKEIQEQEIEVWKELNVEGFKGLFDISNQGNARKKVDGSILRSRMIGSRYTISQVCNGKYKAAYGYKWSYA